MQRDGIRNLSVEEQVQQAHKKVAESQQRENEMRQTLKSARKEHEKELLDVRQRFDQEKAALVQQASHICISFCNLCADSLTPFSRGR